MSNALQVKETVRLLLEDAGKSEVRDSCVRQSKEGVWLYITTEDGEEYSLGSLFREVDDDLISQFEEELEEELEKHL
ncbi:hypothetical protein A4G99_07045 [Haladaptatus sp. R4]|uniref:hypothetical protein n=1 Tax=Haladaptatus sp. R4 TaxID=1679489 RepID=UPI0007B49F26|nr:hypothetical protein [Haladaptatus sp. R4]KZN24192.1 hypothetical protein A4G99_07045 [Haladaptatus sp. R4]